MKRVIFTFIILIFAANIFANMAYMGPQDAHASGQQVMQNIRVQHEILTADMRKLPSGNISVFAQYKILCTGQKGKIRFLFVASSSQPVVPEFILDGKIIKSEPVISEYSPSLYQNPTPSQKDSMSQIIGYDLIYGDFNTHQLLDQLFVFDVEMNAGFHQLKIGYDCSPTGYEKGNLRYTTFPYFLGNKYTRNLYDSIFVRILLPEGVKYESNFECKIVNGTLESGNIAGFAKSHITISVYKDLEKEIAYGYNIFVLLQYFICFIFVCTTIIYIHWRKRRNKRLLISLLWVIPVALAIPILYVIGLDYYYDFYTERFGPFLRGSFGKGYYLILIFPFIAFAAGICWLAIALVYHYWVYGKKWDPMRIFRRVKD